MKTLLITGATGAIGTALCKRLAKQDNHLIITARDQQKLTHLTEQLKSEYKIKVDYVTSDFNDTNSYTALLKLVKNGLDGFVIMPPQPPITQDCLPQDNIWSEMFNKSFIGPSALMRDLIPSLIKRKASVVLISGITSKQPLTKYATSSVLRTAWQGQIKTLADTFGPEDVRFNTLSLGGVITDKLIEKINQEIKDKNISLEEALSKRTENVPLRKYADLNEIVDMIEFMLMSEASKHLTGQNIVLDGGFTRSY